MSLDNLRDWVGKTQTVEDLAAPYPVRAMSATLDEGDPEPRIGDPLPPLWHWLYFLDPRQSKIGPDGHPERGDFLPPVPLPRRMWAGSRFTFDGAAPGRRHDHAQIEIKSVEPRAAPPGAMVFVTVRHTVSGTHGAGLHRGARHRLPRGGQAGREADGRPSLRRPTPPGRRRSMPDPVLLFRYSALTFNGHRIHYDHPM